jgi:phosphate transport system substrate-binding protein
MRIFSSSASNTTHGRARWRRSRACLAMGFVLVGAVALVSATGPAPAGASSGHEQIEGSGSSWAFNAVNQWVTDVTQKGLQVVFTPSGSAQGRQDFANGVTDFAVSDIGYQGQNPITGGNDSSLRPYAYLPIVGGATAFPYNLVVAGHRVENLRLSGLTLAKIFTNQITNWDDPEITADNNGRQLPPTPIIPVIHSEGAGTTYEFTDWIFTEFPSLWESFSGYHFPVEFWPTGKGSQVAENGSDGVMNFIASGAGNGSIGFDEYSYALGANFPVLALENSAGYFTMPDAYNAAVSLTKAQINYTPGPNYLLETLNNVYTFNDPRTYALSSYSYEIEPTAPSCSGPNTQCDPTMNTPKRQTLADFDTYALCQGQAEMAPIGYSPLPVNLVEASFQQVGLLHKADPGVSLANVNVANCHNPTFIPGQPTVNFLAQIAPLPPACAKAGEGPCPGQYAHNGNPVAGRPPQVSTGGTPPPSAGSSGSSGSGAGSSTPGGASAGGASTAGGASNAGGTSSGGASTAGGSSTKRSTTAAGRLTASSGSNGSGGTSGTPLLAPQPVPTILAADHPAGLSTLAVQLLVAFLVLLCVAAPPIWIGARRRRRET